MVANRIHSKSRTNFNESGWMQNETKSVQKKAKCEERKCFNRETQSVHTNAQKMQ